MSTQRQAVSAWPCPNSWRMIPDGPASLATGAYVQRILTATLFGFLVGAADAKTPSPLSVAGDEVVMRTAARGVQVYECRSAVDGALA